MDLPFFVAFFLNVEDEFFDVAVEFLFVVGEVKGHQGTGNQTSREFTAGNVTAVYVENTTLLLINYFYYIFTY